MKLKEQVDHVTAEVTQYEDLANQTVAKNQAISENRKALDAAAAKYMKNCSEFLHSQNEAMAAEIGENRGRGQAAWRG